MPDMTGQDLAEQVKRVAPDIAVLFMSGYTLNAAGHRGILEKGVLFIQKPFTPNSVARKVREALGNEK